MSSVVAAWRTGSGPSREEIQRMADAAPHRGRLDGYLAIGQVALGITNGDTKWSSLGKSGAWACAIQGPVDNATDLQGGTSGENLAETIGRLYERDGEETIGRLRGAFAGVVTNGEDLVCFRDHIGGRPLFYRHETDEGWVGTEAKQVVAGALIPREPDLEAIELTFYRGISQSSALRGIRRVFYGEAVLLQPGHLPRARRYWDPESVLESRRVTAADAPHLLAEQMEIAVTRVVHGSDVVALSGGIDSPTIAAFAAPAHLRRSGRRLGAYTAIYPRHQSVDESVYARGIARYLDIELRTFEPVSPILDNVERWVDLADGPWDSLPMTTALEGYRLAKEMGGTQVLTGTLAEYVFTINRFILGHLLLRGRWKALGSMLSTRRSTGRSLPSLGKQLLYEITPSFLGRSYARLRRKRSTFFPIWVDLAVRGETAFQTALSDPVWRRWVGPTIDATRGTTSTQEAIEVCASTTGIVVRNPLADRDLWDFFLSLPIEAKFGDVVPKSILRTAMRGKLPDSILDRRDKTVFDEHVIDTTPWERIVSLIDDPDYRMPGINYDLLKERISQRLAGPVEVVWASDLATVHAFLRTFK